MGTLYCALSDWPVGCRKAAGLKTLDTQRRKYEMKKLIRIIPVVIILSLTLTGCLPTEETPTDTLQTEEEFLSYLQESEDEQLSALGEYYSPVNIPEGMALNRIEVQPERHLITFYYNLGRYEPTIEELAEEATKDIDLSAFSLFGMFPSANRQKETYTVERAERAVLKETDEYQFRWNYQGDGEELLQKGLEYYGEETEMEGKTGYVTPVTARMLIANTPEGVGTETVFYQVVWVEDGRLFFAKVPTEFAENPENLAEYMQIEKKMAE